MNKYGNGLPGLLWLTRLLLWLCVGVIIEVVIAACESLSLALFFSFHFALAAAIVAVAVMRVDTTLADD